MKLNQKEFLNTPEELEKIVNLTLDEKRALRYASSPKLLLTNYYLSLIDKNNPNCPIRKQVIPTSFELRTTVVEANINYSEILPEKMFYRKNNKVVLILTEKCAIHCRFCNRKKIIDVDKTISEEEFKEFLDYILSNEEINSIVLSGGDPFILENETLNFYLSKIREIKHIKDIFIETKIPIALPSRIEQHLINILQKNLPVDVIVHINHPKEITQEFISITKSLLDSGLKILSQTVLLKDINDKLQVLISLFTKLSELKIKPYSLYHPNIVPGTEHFRTTILAGLKLYHLLCSYNLTLPKYKIGLTCGDIPLDAKHIVSKSKTVTVLKDDSGKIFYYPEKPEGLHNNELIPIERR